ncbi:MAG: hypothetical protein ACFCUG_08425 [Thiotrichales bacterium]
MKRKKLLEKLGEYLSADHREQLKRKESLKKLLHNLREKRDELKAEIAATADTDERERLQAKLDVLAAQREKGLQLLKNLQGATPDSG